MNRVPKTVHERIAELRYSARLYHRWGARLFSAPSRWEMRPLRGRRVLGLCARRCRRGPVVRRSMTPACARQVITVGDVIAISRGGGTTELGVVTGTDSSGRNVDFQPLEPFVPELYVHSSDGTPLCAQTWCARVPSTYVPAQDGWIVLAADVAKAEDSFASSIDLPPAEVVEAPPKVLSEEALRKQSFLRPTRTQAFLGSALSLPVSALAYAVFAGERASFKGEGNIGALEDVALVAAASIAVLSIIVGCALFCML